MDAMHLSVFHSISNRASGKRSSVPAPYTFNTLFFSREQETVRYSSYIILLIFT